MLSSKEVLWGDRLLLGSMSTLVRRLEKMCDVSMGVSFSNVDAKLSLGLKLRLESHVSELLLFLVFLTSLVVAIV